MDEFEWCILQTFKISVNNATQVKVVHAKEIVNNKKAGVERRGGEIKMTTQELFHGPFS
jgi:hypothetical protein